MLRNSLNVCFIELKKNTFSQWNKQYFRKSFFSYLFYSSILPMSLNICIFHTLKAYKKK